MTTNIHERNKTFINLFRAALYDCDVTTLPSQLREIFAPDCQIHLTFPFEDLTGPDQLFEQVYQPLLTAMPDVERRDFIVMAGESRGRNWVGCGGNYIGLFEQPWLDIPPTQHAVFMRYHEFFCIEDERVVEMQALWDIPQVMMQAQAWPMTPALGVEWMVPGPAHQDGLLTGPYDAEKAQASVQLVVDMLAALKRSTESVEAMELDRYWHPKVLWYGPAGIGSMRRIAGFRNWHQIPYLNAMPDRRATLQSGIFFGDGPYVGFTDWPAALVCTLTGDGWLGIPPTNQTVTMRSLDFWRCENGQIRENWVLVDLLDVYQQLGVDVFSRMRELTVARQPRR